MPGNDEILTRTDVICRTVFDSLKAEIEAGQFKILQGCK